jgi:small subunit ribosomal protein S20
MNMPSHKSAAKRIRTSERRRLRNKAKKTRMKSLIKDLQGAETKEQAMEIYRTITSHLDRIASSGVIHVKNAARKKSRLAKLIQSKNFDA